MEWLTHRFELSRGGDAHNVRPMEGMRGFAVFLVFLVHFVTLARPWFPGHAAILGLCGALQTAGQAGVDLFFVLSGYLIYGSLISRPQRFVRFMKRRIQRIYPAFAAVFLAYVVLSFVFPAENKIPGPAGAGLVYLIENFLLLPGLFPIEAMITVAWSLSYEMFYYLTIPLLIGAFKLRERSAAWRVVFFLALATATVAWCATRGGPVRLIMFVSGILLHEAIGARGIPTPPAYLGLVALAAGLLGTLLPLPGYAGFALKIGILFLTFFVLCLACFREPSAWLPRAFSWTPLRWLGNMSYSYYLLHGLALKGAFLALGHLLPLTDHGAWLFWALLPAMFALSLVPTTALFLAIERPFSLAPARPVRGAPAAASPTEHPLGKPAAAELPPVVACREPLP